MLECAPGEIMKQTKVVDWNKLHRAKEELVKLIWNQPDSPIWAIVEHVNELQQAALDGGIWSFPEKSAPFRWAPPLDKREGDLCWDTDRAVGMEWRDGAWVDVSYDYWVIMHQGKEPK